MTALASPPPIIDLESDEQTPLLNALPKAATKAIPPDVKMQLAIIFLIQLCEPLSGTVIYAFVNQLVRSTGVTGGDEKKTGYYAGIIESLFFWAEGATALGWQLASNKVGRRPVILMAPLGLGLSMLAFGLSTKFWQLVLFRTFQGIFNGDVGVSKTVLGELTDSSNRADIMSKIPVMYTLGSCLAPFIGGFFSSPAEQWPNIFGNISLLRSHPYFLPCAITTAICFVTFVLAVFGLRETAPSVLKKREYQRLRNFPSEQSTTTLEDQRLNQDESSTQVSALLTRPVLVVLVLGALRGFCNMSYKSLQALIWSTSIQNGGLGFDARRIGLIDTLFGIPCSILQFVALPRMIKFYGPRNSIVICFTAILACSLLYPLQTYFASKAGEVDGVVWILISLQMIIYSLLGGLGYASNLVLLVEVCPDPENMGAIQGLSQTVSVIFRGIAPSVAMSLFSFSTEHNVLGGTFVFLVLGVINLAAISVGLLLPSGTGALEMP